MTRQILDKRRRSISIWQTSAILASVVEYLEDRIALTDFGDAPSPYPTTLSENGARHAEGGPRLGTSRDSESDGVHSATAQGDELADLADEDGVRFGALMVGALGATANVSVSGANQGARLDAWIDFNGDGSWGEVNEQIADSVPVTNGENFIRFDVPASARSGTTFARFRISTNGGLGIRGLGADGEVEDLSVPILSPVASNGRFGTERPIGPGTFIGWPSVAAADMDQDGDMDVIAGSFTADTVSWFENDGHQRFTTHVVFSAANGVRDVGAADLDGDGDLDIFSASANDNRIRGHFNDGQQNFATRVLATGAVGVVQTVPSDLDQDGDIDLVSAFQSSDSFVWHENSGTASFTPHVISNTADGAEHISVADLDRDGDLDIVGSSINDGNLSWYQNDGQQNFSGQVISRFIRSSQPTVIDDIDSDGDFDVLVGPYVFRNDGFGGLGGYDTILPVGPFGRLSVSATSDFDGDGDRDVLGNGETTTWYENAGSDGFLAHGTGDNYQRPIPADIDGDGDVDILAVGFGVQWFENGFIGPQVTSITRKTPLVALTNASRLVFLVTFSEDVTGVDGADFLVSGPAASVSVTPLTGSTYEVTVFGPSIESYNGTVGLDIAPDRTIKDLDTYRLARTEPAVDELYSLDHRLPTADIVDIVPDPRDNAVGTVSVTFSEPVTGVDLSDFTLTRDGVPVSLEGVLLTGSGRNYTIDLSSISSLSGRYRLTLKSLELGILDRAGNQLTADVTDEWDCFLQTISLSTDLATIGESGTVVVSAALTAPVSSDVVVNLDFDGPAARNIDYSANSHQIIISAGNLSGSITLTAIEDDRDEPDEVVTARVVSVVNAAGVSASTNITIIDNDAIPITASVINGLLVIADSDTRRSNSQVVFDSNFNELVVSSLADEAIATSLRFPAVGIGGVTATLGTLGDRLDLSGMSLPSTVQGGAGSDTILGSQGADVIHGNAGNDIITANNGHDMVIGGLGDDSVQGGVGRDSLVGGEGNDSLFGQSGVDTLEGGAGIDLLDGGSSGTVIVDDFAGQIVIGNTGYQSSRGDRASGELITLATLTGSAGNDSVDARTLTNGLITVFGGAGNDTLRGGAARDTFYGEDGNDVVNGAGNDDFLSGGDGDDTVNGVGGLDTLSGGLGDDVLNSGSSFANWDVRFDEIREFVPANLTIGVRPNSFVLTLTGLGNDRVEGFVSTLVITGSSQANIIDARGFIGRVTIAGGDGNDWIRSGSSSDRLMGGAGDDTLEGNAGSDFIDGGTGNDMLSGGAGNDTLSGRAGVDTVFERLDTDATIDQLTITSVELGTDSTDSIEGLVLIGGMSNNRFDATNASVPVTLLGGLGNDFLIGSSLRDVLIGGHRTDSRAGVDTLTGGGQIDVLDDDPDDSRLDAGQDRIVADLFARLPQWIGIVDQ